MFYFKDDKGKPSLSTTLAVVGVIAALGKLYLSGFACCGIKFADFGGSDFAMVVSPFLALLAHKKQVESKASEDQAKQQTE
jgi:hypothetical protein